MPATYHMGAGELAVWFACSLATVPACTGGEAALGESCAEASDCESGLQCFESFCTEQCRVHVDCGDGYRCEPGGQCAPISSAIGDPCTREIDCGPGQACALDGEDQDRDGTLAGTCQLQRAGLPTGAECDDDDNCQVGICSLGRCTQLCDEVGDCPPGLVCASVPRLLADSSPHFTACFVGGGVIADDLPMEGQTGTVRVPVPSHARSVAIVTQVAEEDQMVGATSLVGPDGTTLYATPAAPEDFYANLIRYQPAYSISTLLLPNTPAVDLRMGVYEVQLGSQLDLGGQGTAAPRVRVYYKLDASSVLDLHFYFLDLAEHPCAIAFDGGQLDARSARESPRFLEYVAVVDQVFAAAGIELGNLTYDDITGRGDLDAVEQNDARKLFALSTHSSGVNVFFVRSIAPPGVQAVVGGIPGPPRTPGSAASGLAIGLDTLCYRNWQTLARISAHAIARQMGLYYNRDPEGHLDTIPDSDDLSTNLMFFGDLGGVSLSQGQGDVLRRYPGLR